MQRYLLQRILLVIPTLWLVISLLFLALRALPGDFVTRKLSNLENQGAEQRESEIIGYIEVTDTTHRVISGTRWKASPSTTRPPCPRCWLRTRISTRPEI